MKYQVDVFVLGCDPELTKDQFEVEAKNQDEAERLAISGGLRSGYGVMGSRPMFEADLISSLEDSDVDEVVDMLKFYGEVRFVDEKIDDGVDDDECEDEYVMMRSYDLKTPDGHKFYIRLYYGNNSYKFTAYDYEEE